MIHLQPNISEYNTSISNVLCQWVLQVHHKMLRIRIKSRAIDILLNKLYNEDSCSVICSISIYVLIHVFLVPLGISFKMKRNGMRIMPGHD